MLYVNDELSTSEQSGLASPGVSSSVVNDTAEHTGASFTGVIVRLNVAVLLSSDPSFALNVNESEPL